MDLIFTFSCLYQHDFPDGADELINELINTYIYQHDLPADADVIFPAYPAS